MTDNLFRYFQERYRVAIGKWSTEKTEQHAESLDELAELLMDPQLPVFYRLKVNMALADGHDDWYFAEEFRHEAERVYAQIRTHCPVGDTRWPNQERHLVALRERLDALAEEQREDDPRLDNAMPDGSLSADQVGQNTTSPHAPSMDAPVFTDATVDPRSDHTTTSLAMRSIPATPPNQRSRSRDTMGTSSPALKRRSPEKEPHPGTPSKKRKGENDN